MRLSPWFTACLVFAGVLSARVTAESQPATRPAPDLRAERTWLLRQFDQRAASRVAEALSQPADNTAGGIAWGHSYLMSALAEMLHATGDSRYAALFVRLGTWVADGRDDRHQRRDEVRGKVLPAWGSSKYSDGKWYVWAVHTGMIAAPMARFGAAVNEHPRLRERFKADAGRFTAIAREALGAHADQFRPGPADGEGHLYGYWLKRGLPLNQQNAPARAWIWLADVAGDRAVLDEPTHLATFLKNRLRLTEDGAYVWGYWPPLDGPGEAFEDISHAAINADFIVLCAENGIVFGQQDVDRVAKTFLTRVMPEPNKVANDLAGRGVAKYPYAPFMWGRLARHDTAVRDRLLEYAHTRIDDKSAPNTFLVGLVHLVAATR
ncbi:MAG: hypothetical protein HY718_13445 [Planctomycetes bacterium]|nr:hypothetical protein [Planctomycetota bacterium]